MGKTSLATNIAFNIANVYEPAQQADGTFKAANGGVVGFFSLEMSSEQLATPHHLGADRDPLLQDQARRDHRIGLREAGRLLADDAEAAACSSTRPAASRSRSSRRAPAG
jgi:hypothetical protein